MGVLPVSTREAIIASLLKPGKDAVDKTAYRPLSMLTSDYKILSWILANRLIPYMTQLVHRDQAGFIPTRNTATNVRRLLCILGESHGLCPSVAILSVDIEKSFDSLEWPYLFHVMRKFGLGEAFVGWTEILYSSATARVRTGANIFSYLPNRTRDTTGVPALSLVICTGHRAVGSSC